MERQQGGTRGDKGGQDKQPNRKEKKVARVLTGVHGFASIRSQHFTVLRGSAEREGISWQW